MEFLMSTNIPSIRMNYLPLYATDMSKGQHKIPRGSQSSLSLSLKSLNSGNRRHVCIKSNS